MRIPKRELGWFCAVVVVVSFGSWNGVCSSEGDPEGCTNPEFFKADANGDERLDITDPLQILRFLFQGGDAPVCFEGSSALDVSDLEQQLAERDLEIARLESELLSERAARTVAELALGECQEGLEAVEAELATTSESECPGDGSVSAGVFSVQVPSTAAGPEGVAVRVWHPGSEGARYDDAAPIAISVSGGWSKNRLSDVTSSPEGVAQGFVVVEFLLPGSRQLDGEATGGAFDTRGFNCRAVLADVIRYAGDALEDAEGSLLSDRVSYADATNLGIVGRSNGGNLVLTTLAESADSLPPVAWFVAWETPVGDQFGAIELNHNPYYRPGTSTATTCPTPGMEAALVFDRSGVTRFVDVNGNEQELSGLLCADLDGNNSCEPGDVMLGGIGAEDAPGLYSLHNSQELAAMVASRGPTLFGSVGPPRWMADETETAAFWALRDGALVIPELSTSMPDLLVIHVQTAFDHVQTQPDHPHAAAHLQGWLDAGHSFVRLNADASYVAAAAGLDASQVSELDANTPVPWPGVAVAVPAETITGVPTAPFMTPSAMAELADRSRDGDLSADLDEPLYNP